MSNDTTMDLTENIAIRTDYRDVVVTTLSMIVVKQQRDAADYLKDIVPSLRLIKTALYEACGYIDDPDVGVHVSDALIDIAILIDEINKQIDAYGSILRGREPGQETL